DHGDGRHGQVDPVVEDVDVVALQRRPLGHRGGRGAAHGGQVDAGQPGRPVPGVEEGVPLDEFEQAAQYRLLRAAADGAAVGALEDEVVARRRDAVVDQPL